MNKKHRENSFTNIGRFRLLWMIFLTEREDVDKTNVKVYFIHGQDLTFDKECYF